MGEGGGREGGRGGGGGLFSWDSSRGMIVRWSKHRGLYNCLLLVCPDNPGSLVLDAVWSAGASQQERHAALESDLDSIGVAIFTMLMCHDQWPITTLALYWQG